MAINPAGSVLVTPEHNKCVYGTAINQCIEAGVETTMLKAHYAHCLPTIHLKPKHCEDRVQFVMVPAGAHFETAVKSGASMCLEFKGCLAYVEGTEEAPMVIPADLAYIEENAPELLREDSKNCGRHTKSLNCVTEFALINCSSEPIKVQLTFKGC